MGCGASKDSPHDPNTTPKKTGGANEKGAKPSTADANNNGSNPNTNGLDKWAEIDNIIPWQVTAEALEARQILWTRFDVTGRNNLTLDECLAGCCNELQLHLLFPDEIQIANASAWYSTHLLREKPDATINVDPQEWRLYLRFLRDDIQLAAVFSPFLTAEGTVGKAHFLEVQDMLSGWGAYIPDPEVAWAEMTEQPLPSIHFGILSDWLVKNRLDRESAIATQLMEQQAIQQQHEQPQQEVEERQQQDGADNQQNNEEEQPQRQGQEELYTQQQQQLLEHQQQQQHAAGEHPPNDGDAPIATQATAEEDKVSTSDIRNAAATADHTAIAAPAPASAAPAPHAASHDAPPAAPAPAHEQHAEKDVKPAEQEKPVLAPAPVVAAAATAPTAAAPSASAEGEGDAAEIQKAATFSAKVMTEEEKARYLSEIEHRSTTWALIGPKIPRQKTKSQNEARNALFKLFDPAEVGSINFAQAVKGADEHLQLSSFNPKLDTAKLYRRAFGHAANARTNLANGTRNLNFDESTTTIERNEFRLFLAYIYNYLELCVGFDALQIHPESAISFSTFSAQLVPLMVDSWGVEPLVPSPKEVFDKELDSVFSLGMITFDMFSVWAVEKLIEAQNLAAEQKKKSKKAAGEAGGDEAAAPQAQE